MPLFQSLTKSEQSLARSLKVSTEHTNSAIAESLAGSVSGKALLALHDQQWLSDEVINGWMKLVEAKWNSDGSKRVLCMNSFFWQKLTRTNTHYDFAGVRNWTKKRKTDIFEYEIVLLPLHVGANHWTLAVVDILSCAIEYLDSRGDPPFEGFEEWIKHWIVDEYEGGYGFEGRAAELKNEGRKRSASMAFSPESLNWPLIVPEDIPQQSNDHDCGIFVCLFAAYLAAGKDIRLIDDIETQTMRDRVLVAFCNGFI